MTKRKITIWGAPGSGKTTFLAALYIAVTRSKLGWSVVPKDDAAIERFSTMTAQLVEGREFPEVTSHLAELDCRLVGPPRTQRRPWFRRAPVAESTNVDLSLVDMPGAFFGTRLSSEPVDLLTGSDGLLFLFDPIREFQSGDSFDYFHRVLYSLAYRTMASDASTRLLPHRLAVCVTKFDDVRVLATAERLGLVTTDPDDPYHLPRVDPQDTEELFTALCERSASGNGDMLLSMIRQFFRPERVRFFATSAIGFHVDPARRVFDPDDVQNVVPSEEGHRIRGAIQPINVLEPILWLADQLSLDG
ncbi:hypothetical protein [Nonomuraea sp. NPDC048916]|uniref:hypothetical protein n=1 Tax=Nonomuraea sp. NPDC048916 TaxID=3154232 RepID=UPI0033EFD6E1